MNTILSICIPTYNRVRELEELIDSVLSISSEHIDIIVVDNCSTDTTREMVLKKGDQRLVYYYNEKPLPAFLNMIHSLFKADGKYALYCNDRDLLLPDRVEKLIKLLENKEYAFLISPICNSKNDESLREFDSAYESFCNQDLIHHPTGMVFNRELMGEYLSEEKYWDYLDSINVFDFLMLDLFQYGKTAIYNCGYWKTRDPEYLASHKSGGKIYFTPDVRSIMFYRIMDYVLINNGAIFNEEQKQGVIDHIYLSFCFLFSKYKFSMADKYETAHYGISTRNVSSFEMLKIYIHIFHDSITHLQDTGYSQSLIRYVKSRRLSYYCTVIKICLKFDIKQILKRI